MSTAGTRSWGLKLGLALSGFALLAFVVYRTGWRPLAHAFTRLGWSGAGAVIFLGLVESLLDGLALHRVLLARISSVFAVAANSVGTLVNSAVPYEAGEVAKGLLLARRAPDTLTGLLVWNYVWKLSKPIAGVLALVSGALMSRVFSLRILGLVTAGCALMFLPYLVLRLVVRARPVERLVWLLGRLPLFARSSQRFMARATWIDADMTAFLRDHRGPFASALWMQVAARLTGVMTVGVVLSTVAPSVDPLSAGVIYAALSSADLLLMLVPVRFGVGESVFYLLFSALGLDPTLGLIMGLVLRFRQVVANGVLAGGLFLR